MSFQAFGEMNRSFEFTVYLYEDDGVTGITLDVGDVVRFKVGRRPEAAPVIDLDSAGPSDNGSTITIEANGPDPAAEVTIAIHEDDVNDLNAYIYDAEVLVYDVSKTRVKSVELGTLSIETTLGGSVGAT